MGEGNLLDELAGDEVETGENGSGRNSEQVEIVCTPKWQAAKWECDYTFIIHQIMECRTKANWVNSLTRECWNVAMRTVAIHFLNLRRRSCTVRFQCLTHNDENHE